ARVAAEGLAVELAWTAAVDLDLEVIEPDGAVCTFADTGEVATEAGGSHSGDANAFCTMQITNLERVTYPATRPAGSYRARAALADDCALNQRGFFTLTVRGAGLTSGAASGDLAVSGEVTATFTTSLPFDVVDDS
ncbi:MAG: hypothetical protein H6835_20815, partial [Planctomycetes bacterium]|nr:hypothetical protein [Planctomycetota bacterium]